MEIIFTVAKIISVAVLECLEEFLPDICLNTAYSFIQHEKRRIRVVLN